MDLSQATHDTPNIVTSNHVAQVKPQPRILDLARVDVGNVVKRVKILCPSYMYISK